MTNKVYRAYFLKQLKIALEGGLLALAADFPTGKDYKIWKEKLYTKEWVVYTKPPFSKPENVVNYMARYSHRIAITNQRIIKITDDEVTFSYKDYKDGAKTKIMTLKGKDFLQRFCLHILPDRFRKIRHYGFLSNAAKKKSLTLAKKVLQNKRHITLSKAERKAFAQLRLFGLPNNNCPCCGIGKMIHLDSWEPNRGPPVCINVATVK